MCNRPYLPNGTFRSFKRASFNAPSECNRQDGGENLLPDCEGFLEFNLFIAHDKREVTQILFMVACDQARDCLLMNKL